MSSDPAAAVASARLPAGLGSRLARLLAELPAATRAPLAARLSPDRIPLPGPGERDGPAFAWITLPRWLARELPPGARRLGSRVLDDLLWGQLLVYLYFRVQDDLLDGEGAAPALALAAQRLALEALGAFESCGGRQLTELARRLIEEALDAILELHALQAEAERRGEAELAAYGRQSACLRIACAGVLLLGGGSAGAQKRLAGALDRFFIAAQLLDDLEDVAEDLERGRINHAAWRLAEPVFGPTPEAIEAVVASNLVVTDRLERLLEEVAGDLEQAARGLREFTGRGAASIAEYALSVRAMAARLDRSLPRARARERRSRSLPAPPPAAVPTRATGA